MVKTLTLVTGNKHKLEELLHIMLMIKFPRKILIQKTDLPEWQGNIDEIAITKCKEAMRYVQGPVLTEDTSLCFNAWKGMPGPYVKWFVKAVAAEGLHRMLAGYDDKSALAICNICFCSCPDSKPILFKSTKLGTIVEPRGSHEFGWDPIFQPIGSEETYGEMSLQNKCIASHRYGALLLLRWHLLTMKDCDT